MIETQSGRLKGEFINRVFPDLYYCKWKICGQINQPPCRRHSEFKHFLNQRRLFLHLLTHETNWTEQDLILYSNVQGARFLQPTACWDTLQKTDVSSLTPLLYHYKAFSTVPGLTRQHVRACPTFAIYPPTLLPGTEASHPAARSHLSPPSAARLLYNSPTAFSSFTHRHTATPNPHPSRHKSPRPPVLPPPLLGIWRKQCWHSPHPNCSTCSTWPHMFCFFSYNKPVQKLPTPARASIWFVLPEPSRNTKEMCTHVFFWVTINLQLAAPGKSWGVGVGRPSL